MPSFSDRIAGSLRGIAGTVESIARALKGPDETRVSPLPGASRWGEQRRYEQNVFEALRSWGAYSGRIAPDLGPQPTRYSLDPATDLTPEKIIDAQNQARQGYPLVWVEMIDQVLSRDAHYMGTSSQRVEDVVKGTKRLTRATNDDLSTALKNFTHEMYASCARWSDGLGWLLWANAYGYTGVEIEWAEDEVSFPGPKEGEIIGPFVAAVPRQLHPVHPKHFRFDLLTDDPLLWLGAGGQPLPYGKFIFFDGEGLHPIKVRHGHAWQCIWYSMFRSLGLSSAAVHTDRFSLPVPLITYDGDVSQYQEYADAYRDIFNSLGAGKGAILPSTGAEFKINDPPAGGRADDPAFTLIGACDTAQTIRVLGATLTNTSGPNGSYGGITGHLDVKFAKEAQDARRAWERIDEQLGAPLLQFNAYGLARALAEKGYAVTPEMIRRRVPRGKQAVPRGDAKELLEQADLAVNKLGMEVSIEGLFDQVDLARAIDESDRAPGAATQVSRGGAVVGAVEATNEGAEAPPEGMHRLAYDPNEPRAADGKWGSGAGGAGGSSSGSDEDGDLDVEQYPLPAGLLKAMEDAGISDEDEVTPSKE